MAPRPSMRRRPSDAQRSPPQLELRRRRSIAASNDNPCRSLLSTHAGQEALVDVHEESGVIAIRIR